ncbi:MAG: hypothetical protein KatS3mg021_0826 [Fimbriimonadales bacterium]|nr:MAG: hypothetical protein KatS3mg021_0826 [Fimbriimonadales bacterium]
MQQVAVRWATTEPHIEARVVFLREQFRRSAEEAILIERVPIFRHSADWARAMTQLVRAWMGDEFCLVLEGGIRPSPPEKLFALANSRLLTLSDGSELYLLHFEPQACQQFLQSYDFPTLDALWCRPDFVERIASQEVIHANFGAEIAGGRLCLPEYLAAYLSESRAPVILQPYDLLDTGDPIIVYRVGASVPHFPEADTVRLPEWGWTLRDGIVSLERD